MGCEQVREALSARLDGEDAADERAAVDAHLGGCAACREWFDAAAAVTRLARTGLVTVSPGVSDAVLAAAPGPARARLLGGLRVLLGGLGAAQLVLGLAQLNGAGSGELPAHAAPTLGTGVGALATHHMWHESAAWNVALGAGFVWIAARRSRPIGIVPTLTAFVVLLGLLSIDDVAAGVVSTTRLLSHGFVAAGYLVVLALTRYTPELGTPTGGRAGRDRGLLEAGAPLDSYSGEAPVRRLDVAPGRAAPGSASHRRAA